MTALVARSRTWLVAGTMGTALLTGCATGPDAHPRDPFEPFNRSMYKFNDAVDTAVLQPTAKVCDKVVPNLIQTGVRNVFNNLSDAWSAVNSALQGKGQEAMNNFWRFGVNTFLGIGGIFDVATEAQIPRVKQDFGLTLGHWGVPSGPYVVLPLLGASTVRDAAAKPADIYGSPVNGLTQDTATLVGVKGLEVGSDRAGLLEASEWLDSSSLDPYSSMRDLYLADRDARTGQQVEEPLYDPANDGQDDTATEVDGSEAATAVAPAQQAASQPASADATERIDQTEPAAAEAAESVSAPADEAADAVTEAAQQAAEAASGAASAPQ